MSNKQLIILVVVLIIVLIGAEMVWNQSTRTVPSITQVVTPPPPPSLTTDRTVKAIGTKTFSALVSYTDSGFEPNALTIKKGDMIRFTNNSSGAMSISLDGAPVALPPGEYWEATFNALGDQSFHENSHTNMTSIIHVQ